MDPLYSELQKQVQRLQTENSSLRHNLRTIKTDYEQLEDEFGNLDDYMRSFENEVKEQEATIDDQEATIEGLQYDAAENQIDNDYVESLELQLSAKNKEITKWKTLAMAHAPSEEVAKAEGTVEDMTMDMGGLELHEGDVEVRGDMKEKETNDSKVRAICPDWEEHGICRWAPAGKSCKKGYHPVQEPVEETKIGERMLG